MQLVISIWINLKSTGSNSNIVINFKCQYNHCLNVCLDLMEAVEEEDLTVRMVAVVAVVMAEAGVGTTEEIDMVVTAMVAEASQMELACH